MREDRPVSSRLKSTASPPRQARLDNGLRVVVAEDHTIPIAAVNLWYDVGSAHEPAGQHGFAHLFEHLMFQGSAHVGRGEHLAALEACGASNVNATTGQDRTNYYETVPAEELPFALWLEADRMGALALNQENLDNQRDVVKNERRQRYDNQPYGDWLEELLALMFPPGHPYHHPPIGSMADLEAADLATFEAFYATYYAPDNAVLSVVGDVDPPQVLDLAATYFGGLPAGRAASARADLRRGASVGADGVAPPGEARRVLRRDVPAPRIYLAFRTPPFGSHTHDVLTVLATVLGVGRGSVLYRELVLRDGLATPDVGATQWGQVHGSSMLAAVATGRSGVGLARLEAALDAAVAQMAAMPDDELERARALLTASWADETGTVSGRADLYGEYTTFFGEPGLADTALDRLLSVSAEEVRAVAAEVLRPDNRVVLAYEPITAKERAA